jgi:paraquat-inducible protein B
MSDPAELPTARRAPAPPRRGAWLPISALFLAAYLAVDVWRSQGPVVRVHAEQGFGLAEGDPLRYRGIDVGRIEEVELEPGLDRIELSLRIEPEAEALCREGTRFWVVRPEVSVDSVSGLDTIVGARYLSVEPGPVDAPARYEFDALPAPPAPLAVEPEGLLVRLRASVRGGLARGAQLTFRGVPVGVVLDTRLASDATAIEIDAYVEPAYAGLVRADTRFWRTGGLSVSLALTGGISVEAESLRELVVGGIALATPDSPGEPVQDGAAFELLEAAPSGWERWRPSLLVNADLPEPADPGRRLVPLELSFEERRLFRNREVVRSGWGLALAGGVLAPAGLVRPPSSAREGTVTRRVDGRAVGAEAPTWEGEGLAFLPLELEGVTPLSRRDLPEEVQLEDCVVVAPGEAPRALSIVRLSLTGDAWRVDDSLDTAGWPNGGLVQGRDSGSLIGLFVVEEAGARIVPIPEAAWSLQGR